MRTLLAQTVLALWADEAGFVLSAEAVAVGALGVAGLTVGANAISNSVNAELEETAYALRSLDQSYSIPEQRSAGAWTAGSSFTQKPVAEAREELRKQIQRDRAAEEAARKKEAATESKPAPAAPPRKKKKSKTAANEATPVLYAPEPIATAQE